MTEEKKTDLPTPTKNSIENILPRFLLGTVIGVVAGVYGFVASARGAGNGVIVLGFLAVISVSGFFTWRKRKFGLVTGIIVGPIALLFGLTLLLAAICGGLVGHHHV